MHNKNNSMLIKANFIQTANFLEEIIGGILIIDSRSKLRGNQLLFYKEIFNSNNIFLPCLSPLSNLQKLIVILLFGKINPLLKAKKLLKLLSYSMERDLIPYLKQSIVILIRIFMIEIFMIETFLQKEIKDMLLVETVRQGPICIG